MRLLLGAQARALRCAGPARHILTPATSATSRRTGMLGRGTASSAAAGAADGGGGEQQTAAPPADGAPQFRIVSEEVVHKRYLALYNRAVQFPPAGGQGEGPVLQYDVIGHPQADFHFAVVFPYHSSDGTVTLIREYAQGLNQLMWCLPTGGFDPRRHASWEACARAELSEEARLAGGTWEPLLPEGHPGIAEVKWCRNRFHSYLCIDPQPDEAPGSRDQEELTIEVVRVSLAELRRLMLGGDMLLPSVATCFVALERLQQRQQQQQQQAAGDGAQ